MELKSLFLGLVFALGAFGIKSGAGLVYMIKGQRSRYSKGLVLLLFAVAYWAIFEICFAIISRTDLLKYLGLLQSFFQYAMLVHVIIACGLIFWGISLLKRQSSTASGTRAWLAMVIPCPVCLAVIFLTTSFIMSFFPGRAHMAVFEGYIVFIVMVFITSVLMCVWASNQSSDRERKLGLAMITIAAYFVLSILIMPNFKDVDKIYRLAGYRGSGGSLNLKQWIIFGLTTVVAFLGGFIYARRTMREIIP